MTVCVGGWLSSRKSIMRWFKVLQILKTKRRLKRPKLVYSKMALQDDMVINRTVTVCKEPSFLQCRKPVTNMNFKDIKYC